MLFILTTLYATGHENGLIIQAGDGSKFRLRAIVVRPSKAADDLAKRAALLRIDSVHGRWDGIIETDKESNSIIANGNMIRLLYANAPGELDFTEHGIHDAVVIDSTGVWRTREDLEKHLKSPGTSKVSANG